MPPFSVLPHPDTQLLRCRSSASGYRNVYAAERGDDGERRYVAKVRHCGLLITLRGSRSPLPHVAALAVVGWYREMFGNRWREALKKDRRRNPWRVWKSKAYGGWLLAVWEYGERVEVREWDRRFRPARRWRMTQVMKVFATQDEARRYVREWLRVRNGVFAGAAMYRAG